MQTPRALELTCYSRERRPEMQTLLLAFGFGLLVVLQAQDPLDVGTENQAVRLREGQGGAGLEGDARAGQARLSCS